MIWLNKFIDLGQERLLNFYDQLLAAVLQCISDRDAGMCDVAQQTNKVALPLLQGLCKAVLICSVRWWVCGGGWVVGMWWVCGGYVVVVGGGYVVGVRWWVCGGERHPAALPAARRPCTRW